MADRILKLYFSCVTHMFLRLEQQKNVIYDFGFPKLVFIIFLFANFRNNICYFPFYISPQLKYFFAT